MQSHSSLLSCTIATTFTRASFCQVGPVRTLKHSVGYYRRFSQAFLVEDTMAAVSSGTAPIFISYSSKDQALAQELQRAFSKKGVSSFVAARDIAGGHAWESTIRDAILGCREMLVLI